MAVQFKLQKYFYGILKLLGLYFYKNNSIMRHQTARMKPYVAA